MENKTCASDRKALSFAADFRLIVEDRGSDLIIQQFPWSDDFDGRGLAERAAGHGKLGDQENGEN